MAKGFIVCLDGFVFDIMRSTSVLLPRRKYVDLFGISRSLRMAVFGSGSDNGLVCIGFRRLRSNKLVQLLSIITCAAVIGGEFLITGGGDCAIRVYQLRARVPVSQSALHSAPLIAIAGNLDLGMIASIDSDFHLVLETLFDHKFINFASIPRAAKKPLLAVFKSGVVAVAHDQFVSFFDARALLMAKIEEACDVVQIEKYYDLGKKGAAHRRRNGGKHRRHRLDDLRKVVHLRHRHASPEDVPHKEEEMLRCNNRKRGRQVDSDLIRLQPVLDVRCTKDERLHRQPSLLNSFL
jgi:hypothetical protein